MPTDHLTEYRLGESGKVKISRSQLQTLQRRAEQFHQEAGMWLPEEHVLGELGLGRYSDYLHRHTETWGPVVVDWPLVDSCFSRELIGIDRHMLHDVIPAIREAADRDTPVLITGETGTGKELVFRRRNTLT